MLVQCSVTTKKNNLHGVEVGIAATHELTELEFFRSLTSGSHGLNGNWLHLVYAPNCTCKTNSGWDLHCFMYA